MSVDILVVDVGTSASSAALVSGGLVRLLKEPASGSYSWPSAVCLDGGELLVGSAAHGRKRAAPSAFRAEFKRDLGEAAPVPLGERAFAVRDLVAALLRAFGDEARRLTGGRAAERLVLTVPASYGAGDPRRAAMIAAGEAAGFAEVELLTEPVAAAHAPVAGAPALPGDVILVYDFGGGTFDAAVVRVGAAGAHEVLGHAALDDCGGRDVDAEIMAHLRRAAGPELLPDGLPPDAALRTRLHLADFVRGVKHQLSSVEQVEDYPTPTSAPYRLTRAGLTEVIEPLLARTVACSRDLLRAAPPIRAVLLVGGTTRMPTVGAALRDAFGVELWRAEDPDLAVVLGAAALATRSTAERDLPPVPPAPDERPLRWSLPAGGGTLLRWLAAPGTEHAPGAPLAVVRAADSTLWRLTAPAEPVRLAAVHAVPGDRLSPGDWLATVTPVVVEPPPVPDPGRRPKSWKAVRMPRLGESVTEGSVTRWLKRVGDHVEADEPLVEISTDKVDTEVPSPLSGVLVRIVAEEDETVEVGAVLAYIDRG